MYNSKNVKAFYRHLNIINTRININDGKRFVFGNGSSLFGDFLAFYRRAENYSDIS